MNFIRKYRLLMIFIVILLILAGTILISIGAESPSGEKTSGKIMISRWCPNEQNRI